MHVFSFSAVKGRHISAFGSKGATISPVTRGPRSQQTVALHLEPNGVLGSHKAVSDQLLIVTSGIAEVTTESGKSKISYTLSPGNAILWRSGEVHEIRAGHEGLLGIILEGDTLSKYVSMPSRRLQPERG